MAVEIPSSLIRQIQVLLRKEAGVPPCDPADLAPRGLSSFEEAISALDPSAPPYLRCKECRGPLLGGLQSTVCVFCGAEQRREGPPLSIISFNATLGCRKLLQSLDLDGSEVVAFNTESKDSGKGQRMEDGLVLSSLLDIELKWPSEGERVQTSSSNNALTQSTLNLSGVDLDDFFSETKKEVGSKAHHISDEILGPDTKTDMEDFSLFEELRPVDKAVASVETEPRDVDNSSSVWEAEFQSASSQISSTDPNSKDLFQDSFSSYASATVEEQFKIESGMNREGENTAFSSNSSQIPSMNDNWPLDVLWRTADSVVPSAAEQFSGKSNVDDGELKPDSMADDWAQTDLWPTSSKSMLNANENIQSNDDSFDDWQDFTSSGNAPDASSNSWTQAGTAITLSNERRLGISSMSFPDRLEDLGFGNFVQSDMLPGVSDLRKDSSKLDIMQSEASVSGRIYPPSDNPVSARGMNEWGKTETNADVWPVVDKNETLLSTQSPEDANADVQDLLSQMPDLSFMLENHLSIPKKVEPSD